MEETAAHQGASRPLLARMLTNVAWLIGGKGFGAVCSLIYLAILTRSLGLKDFGHFALIFGTSQALIAIVGFQSWQTVVRFGVQHIHSQDWAGFGRLSMMAFILDVIGAVFGCVIAYVAFYHFAAELDLNPRFIDTAFWFNVAALWALVSAPTGIVRALDRFDVAVYVEALVPAGRLIAAAVIAFTGPSVLLFLVAWAVIDLLEAAVYWIVARRLSPKAIRLKYLPQAFQARHENPGLVRFFGITYLSATLEAIFKHGPLLAVGYLVGTSAAGVYRLAHQLAQGLAKLSSLLSRAAYAQIARASVSSAAQEFRALASQTTRLAAIGGAMVVVMVAAVGGHLLALLGGEEFRNGYTILLPLVIVSSIELAGVAFEPVLHATGRARMSLVARFVTVATAAIAILFLAQHYAEQGIAWSLVIGALVGYFVMGMMAIVTLRTVVANIPEGEKTT
ncbi:lipopolysaccharide biosynthesis protein [Qipengyuania huizhouensis]|uniref:lipopolysaccharide biosynthesis protein n=1 Tax=Qipengyuania huizhouensis TaxID=2867245 RepID=UPI0017B6D522|nr:lipopolysaccharide biosynthesis protein [Qipengyuania huizhouensis]MBA4764187.1 lipopolysaccharide biosynthesis protein [Erythrobacter sp.]MBX7461007.1 lipopolysaccharide biosynthesis protein [Qipengyuania huizhouensis]